MHRRVAHRRACRFVALGVDVTTTVMICPMTGTGITDADALPWLLDLATKQQSTGPAPGAPVYDEASQMTYLREPVYELAISSEAGVATKKADRETGEDQKGF